MRAWPSPELPTLSVPGPAVALHDTPSGGLVTTDPRGPARLYVCGITPYDATHLGHANTYVAFDLLNRAWRNAGHRVVYVQNVTDVDDPLLERAAKVNVDWVELAERETELFRQDMTALRVLAPDQYVGAVESIPLVIELIQRLEDLASVDTLTGTLSRAAFLEQASATIASRSRAQRPVSVLMLDLDHFKRINDTHGHAVGDRALRAFGQAMRGALRASDLVGRMGGEEFAVVLPDEDQKGALALADRLRRDVEALRIPLPNGAFLEVTVSIGVATQPPAARLPLARLLIAADEALYRAKADGRNRVVASPASTDLPANSARGGDTD